MSELTVWQRVRVRLACWILSPSLWRLMCARGFCPYGIHEARKQGRV